MSETTGEMEISKHEPEEGIGSVMEKNIFRGGIDPCWPSLEGKISSNTLPRKKGL